MCEQICCGLEKRSSSAAHRHLPTRTDVLALVLDAKAIAGRAILCGWQHGLSHVRACEIAVGFPLTTATLLCFTVLHQDQVPRGRKHRQAARRLCRAPG